eukprot:107658_1
MSEGGEPINADEYTPEEEGLSAFSSLIAFILTLTLTIIHGLKVYSDLYTKERTTVSYRRNKPKITPGYRRMSILTYTCIILYLVTLFSIAIRFNFAVGRCDTGLNLFWAVLDKFGLWGHKCTLYLIFIFRLHEVYGTSAYGYSVRNLRCVGITLIIFCICMFLFMTIFSIIYPVYIDDTDNIFPFFCQIIWKEEYIQLAGGIMILFDVIGSITSVLCFIIPLNKVVKAASNQMDLKQKNDSHQKRLDKMLYAGYKYKILVFVAAFSTLTWIVLMALGITAAATFIGQFDFFINPLCLALMTPYYAPDKYYEKLCCLCIICCDRKKIYRSKASQNHEDTQDIEAQRTDNIDSTVVTDKSSVNTNTVPTNTNTSTIGPSVDTDMAIQTNAQDVPPPNDVNNNYNNMDDENP